MANPSFSHILIGCPASGKSTLAQYLKKKQSSCEIVATDEIRKKLFGDENIQGDWPTIAKEAYQQIHELIKNGRGVIYDATNAKPSWRIELLMHLKKYEKINWIGWYLKTPLQVCLEWNRKRKRQVPDEVIIAMFLSLENYPPKREEGFFEVYEVPFLEGNLAISKIDNILENLAKGATDMEIGVKLSLGTNSG
ncbi:MAG: AAA family ATPase [Geminocystis sp.]|nr:AAA family ATPase [Geminocystis sp.]